MLVNPPLFRAALAKHMADIPKIGGVSVAMNYEVHHHMVARGITFGTFLQDNPQFSVLDAAVSLCYRTMSWDLSTKEEHRIFKSIGLFERPGQALVRAFQANTDPLTKLQDVSDAIGQCYALWQLHGGDDSEDERAPLRKLLCDYLRPPNFASTYAFLKEFIVGTDQSVHTLLHLESIWSAIARALELPDWVMLRSQLKEVGPLAISAVHWKQPLLQRLTNLSDRDLQDVRGKELFVNVPLGSEAIVLLAKEGADAKAAAAIVCFEAPAVTRSIPFGPNPVKETVKFVQQCTEAKVKIVLAMEGAEATLRQELRQQMINDPKLKLVGVSREPKADEFRRVVLPLITEAFTAK
jgi:hypothetical protein